MNSFRRVTAGICTHSGTKLACHAGLGAWITVFYYGPQRWPLLPAHPAPMLAFERNIPFQPAWAIVYQSVFIAHTLALWLPADPRAVKRYSKLLAAAFACGAIVFWSYPTLSPRPDHTTSMIYSWLIAGVDGQRNAFPSLHACMGLLALCAIWDHFRICGLSVRWYLGLATWWIALLYSTLATRQHSILDLLAGIFLAVVLLTLSSLRKTYQSHDALIVSTH